MCRFASGINAIIILVATSTMALAQLVHALFGHDEAACCVAVHLMQCICDMVRISTLLQQQHLWHSTFCYVVTALPHATTLLLV